MVAFLNEEGNEIENDTLLVIPTLPYVPKNEAHEQINAILQPLIGEKQRDWYDNHFYRCLPMMIGNQYGFVIRAEKDFSVFWNGGNSVEDVIVTSDEHLNKIQSCYSHFGYGTVLIEHKWILRTPPKVNLMTVQPPNWFKRGIHHQTGIIETDNLRRNFIFNLKITEPNLQINFTKGEPIACFILLPRFFVENFSIKFADDIYSKEQIDFEFSSQAKAWQKLIDTNDKTRNHYRRGEDYGGNPFRHHQQSLSKKCPKDE